MLSLAVFRLPGFTGSITGEYWITGFKKAGYKQVQLTLSFSILPEYICVSFSEYVKNNIGLFLL